MFKHTFPSQLRSSKRPIKWIQTTILALGGIRINPLGPQDALKQHFTSLKTHLIFLQLVLLE